MATSSPELRYHAIVSRGMLEHFEGGLHAAEWRSWWPPAAPLLEEAWNSCAREERDALAEELAETALRFYGAGSGFTGEMAAELADAAVATGWRSYAEGVDAVRDYTGADAELIFPPEGHTAGIFVAGDVALNVARDRQAAAAELRTNAADLARWHELDARRAPRVLDVGVGRCTVLGRPAELTIVAVEFLHDGDELHLVTDEDVGVRLLRVDEFVHSPTVPLAIRGDRLSKKRTDELWSDVVEWQTRAAAIDWERGTIDAPRIELNDGDVVLRGDDIAFVGSSTPHFAGVLADWPRYAISISTAHGLEPGEALAGIARALGAEQYRTMLEAAFSDR